MKVVVFQPEYPEHNDSEKIFDWIISSLDGVKEADLIVLPEGSNAPSQSPEFCFDFVKTSSPRLIDAAKRAAKRCSACVCINGYFEVEGKLRNRTLFFAPDGELITYYDKIHLPPAEAPFCDRSYFSCAGLPTVVEYDGVRYGFLTCYDAYFDELSEAVANQKPDIILLCSYQRWETPHELQTEAEHTAHKADCFVVRSSWKLSSGLGGNTLVASPDGKTEAIIDTAGILEYEFDPKRKRTSPKNQGMKYRADRNPRFYLPAGPYICDTEKDMPYPRFCAHRGLNTVAPENTLPAFGAAIALGANEIEFDVRASADKVPVICHDGSVDRTTDKKGYIRDMTLDEIKECDAGVKFSPAFAGVKIPTFEEVLKKFSCQAIFNIHVNHRDGDDEDYYKKLFGLIYKYGAEKHVYIAGDVPVMKMAQKLAPDLARCCLVNLEHPEKLLDNAIECECEKMQLFTPYYDRDLINRAKAAGIRLNLFYCDDPAVARERIEWGVDTILTNALLYAK